MIMDKEEAKKEVEKLVKEFLEYSKEEINKKSENQIKSEFIDPLFEKLGWDMRKDAERETKILKGRADYILKIGNQKRLVIEAKSVNVNLTEDEGRQAVSYAHQSNIPFAVLSNFKYVRVYHALSNIKNIDKNLLKDDKSYLIFNCENFIEQFDRLWLLSKESFEKEEIDKLLDNVDKKLIKPIDKSILIDLLQYREWLSKDLKEKRMPLTDPKIDEIVQILIDRLMFMRSVEDRGLEGKDFLLTVIDSVQKRTTDKNLWALLKDQFKRFDTTYNSKLFSEGILEKDGAFSDDILIKVVKGLYYGTQHNQERYMFDVISIDLLGSIYEQYLGVVLRGTEKRVKLDLVSGKRKKMGIYYTPSYIVDYIVKNTIGEHCKNKSIDEILDIKVVDPACGSGSFLINAFQGLIDLIETRLKNGEKSEKWDSFKDYKDRLTLGQKATILLNCIYGVDLDEKAVELAQLNLLLKILEEETRETRKRILPNMKDNIKNGNSLIEDSQIAGEKAFKWEAQFPHAFKKGGFDIIIGNPPYVSQKGTEDNPNIDYKEREYYRKSYKTLSDNELKTRGGVKLNLFGLWIERAITKLNDNGVLGLIVHKNLLKVESYKYLRKYILDNTSIGEIVDLGADIFEGVTGETIILTLRKNKINDNKIDARTKVDLKNNTFVQDYINQDNFYKNSDYTFNIYENSFISKLKEKVRINSKPLDEIYKIVSFGLNTKDNKKYFSADKNNDKWKKSVMGRHISRWVVKSFGYVFYDKTVLTRDGDVGVFEEKEKLIMQRIGADLTTAYDEENLYCYNSTNMIINKVGGYPLKYLLVLLNSRLINYYYKNVFSMNSNLTVNITQGYLSQIPIHIPSKVEEQEIIALANRMLVLQKKLYQIEISGNEKENIKQQITNVDYEINEEIYKLYNITKKEKDVIESS